MRPLYIALVLVFALVPFMSNSVKSAPAQLPPLHVKGDAVGIFPYLLKMHTQTFSFSPQYSGPQSNGVALGPDAAVAVPGVVGSVESFSYLNGYGGDIISPSFMLVGSLADTALMTKLMNDMERSSSPTYLPGAYPTQTAISLTYWNNELVNAQTLYFAYKTVAADIDQIENYRRTLLSEYPVDNEIVVQVSITNGGFAPFTLSPFSWHLYLLDTNGLRYKSLSYDSALDQTIQPGQTIAGKVLFVRKDPNSGIDLENENGGITGILEDVGGKMFHFTL